MSTVATIYRLHRWASWLVGAQVLAWVLGGVLFAWLPFEAWVKAGDVVRTPQPVLPAGWVLPAGAQGLAVVATPAGPALRVQMPGAPAQVVGADGRPLPPPTAEAVRAFAAGLHLSGAAITDVQRLAEVPNRLGIVHELGGRGDVWRVQFGDRLGTRIYLDGASGAFLTARTDAWVVYDLLWRLHIMDYGGGEDFNNTLLRLAALAVLALTLAGVVLAVRAGWRQVRRAWA